MSAAQGVVRTSGLQIIDALIAYFVRYVCVFCIPALRFFFFFFFFYFDLFLSFSGGVRCLCFVLACHLFVLRIVVAPFSACSLLFFACSLHFLCVWGARGSERLWEGWKCKKPRRCCMFFYIFFALFLHVLCICFALSLRFFTSGAPEVWRGSGKAGNANNLGGVACVFCILFAFVSALSFR